jgi:hypothetical protein
MLILDGISRQRILMIAILSLAVASVFDVECVVTPFRRIFASMLFRR